MPKRNTLNQQKRIQSPCDPDPVIYQDVSKVHPALRPYLGYCLHKVSTMFKSRVNGVFLEHNMQGHHFATLSVIASSPDINQIKLCDEMGVDKASMVKIIDHLEKQKLIERVASKEDRRVKNLVATPKGQKFLLTAQSKRAVLETEFLAALSKDEIRNLKEILLKILDSQKTNRSNTFDPQKKD